MKKISIFNVIMVSFMAIFAQTSFGAEAAAMSADVSIEQQKQLAEAFAVVKNATNAIDQARELLLGAENKDAQNVATIIEQNNIKVLAEQKLVQLRDQLAAKVEATIAPEGYLSRMVTGAKNIGSGIAAYFAAGKGTAEEKEIAKLVIKGLTEQEVKITENYAALQKGLAPAEQAALKVRYDGIITQLEAAMYEQQVITGDTRMGMIKRSLLLGAAAAGTAAMGVMLANQYFGGQPATGTGSTAPTTGPVEPIVQGGPVIVTEAPAMPGSVPTVQGLTEFMPTISSSTLEKVTRPLEPGTEEFNIYGKETSSQEALGQAVTAGIYEAAGRVPGAILTEQEQRIAVPTLGQLRKAMGEEALEKVTRLGETEFDINAPMTESEQMVGEAVTAGIRGAAKTLAESYEKAHVVKGTGIEGQSSKEDLENLGQAAKKAGEALLQDLGEAVPVRVVKSAAGKLKEVGLPMAEAGDEFSGMTPEERAEAQEVVHQRIEKGKKVLNEEFEKRTGKTINEAAGEFKEAAAQTLEQGKRFAAEASERIKGMLSESSMAKVERQMAGVRRDIAEKEAAQEETLANKLEELAPKAAVDESTAAKVEGPMYMATEPAESMKPVANMSTEVVAE